MFVHRLTRQHDHINATLTEVSLRQVRQLSALSRQDCASFQQIQAWQHKVQQLIQALRPAVHAWDAAAVERLCAEIERISVEGRVLRKNLTGELERLKREIKSRETDIANARAALGWAEQSGGFLSGFKARLRAGTIFGMFAALVLFLGLTALGYSNYVLPSAILSFLLLGTAVGLRYAARLSIDRRKHVHVEERQIRTMENEYRVLSTERDDLEQVLSWFVP
jgi:hypothetical protein